MKKNNRILVTCQHFWPEQFRITDIALFLKSQGDFVDVLCGIPNYPQGKFYNGYGFFRPRKQKYKGIDIYRSFEIPRGKNSNFGIVLNYISYALFSSLRVLRLIFNNYDQVLIYQLSPISMALPGLIYGKIRRKPVVMYILDPWPENLYSVIPIKNTFIRKILESTSNFMYRRADKIIVLSEAMRIKALAITHLPETKVCIIPQTCESIYESRPLNSSLIKKYSGTFNFVYTGNISPAQNYPIIVNAALELVRKGVKNFRFIIVGDGMSKLDFQQMVSSHKLSEYFDFLGNKPFEKIPEFAAIADVFIGCLVPSAFLDATIPAKVYSYLALGKPIVLSMSGEVRTMIEEEAKCGKVSEAGDLKSFANNLEHMYRIPRKDRQKLGKNAESYHQSNLSSSKIYTLLYDFLYR